MHCQTVLDGLSTSLVKKSSRAAANLYDFICHIIELRIAVAVYGEEITGYSLSDAPAALEEEKKEVDG